MDRFSSAGLEKMPILDILLWSGGLCGYWLGVAVVGGCVDLQTRLRKEDPMCQFFSSMVSRGKYITETL